MDKREQYQMRMDVERLRKAAERIAVYHDALREAENRLEVAAQALRLIAAWAHIVGQENDLTIVRGIETRAMDVLRLIGKAPNV